MGTSPSYADSLNAINANEFFAADGTVAAGYVPIFTSWTAPKPEIAAAIVDGQSPAMTEKGDNSLKIHAAFFFGAMSLRLISTSAICTAFKAAPLRRLSETHQKVSPFSAVASSRMREIKVASSPAASCGVI